MFTRVLVVIPKVIPGHFFSTRMSAQLGLAPTGNYWTVFESYRKGWECGYVTSCQRFTELTALGNELTSAMSGSKKSPLPDFLSH